MKRFFQYAMFLLLAFFVLIIVIAVIFPPAVPKKVPPAKPHERLIGLAVAPSSQDYGASLMDSFAAGSVVYEISQQWRESGTEENTAILRVLADLMRKQNIPIVLTLNPLDTMENQIPDDLLETSFDDPRFIDRYRQFVDATLAELDGVKVHSIAVGNEVDILLDDDPVRWDQYGKFFDAAKAHLRTVCPDASLGVKFTYDGLTKKQELAAPIVDNCDCIMMTYYPVGDTAVRSAEAVAEEIEGILSTFPDHTLHLNEIGYPYSAKLGSSRDAQAKFIGNAFAVFDNQPRIELMNFVWLNDMPPAAAKQLADAMGGGAMAEFLTTLGLRDHNGNATIAFDTFAKEAGARGYQPDQPVENPDNAD